MLTDLLRIEGYGWGEADAHGIQHAISPRLNFVPVAPYDALHAVLKEHAQGRLAHATSYNTAAIEFQMHTRDKAWQYGLPIHERDLDTVRAYAEKVEKSVVCAFKMGQGQRMYHLDWSFHSEPNKTGILETYLVLRKETGSGRIIVKGTVFETLFPIPQEMCIRQK